MQRRMLKGVSFRQGDHWTAVCLDSYLMTFAPTKEQLRPRIYEMLATHIEACLDNDQEPFSALPKAPERYWRIWEAATDEQAESPPEELLGRAFPELLFKTAEAAVAETM